MKYYLGFVLMTLCAACGSKSGTTNTTGDSNTTNTTVTPIDVSVAGTLAPFPVANPNVPDLTNINIGVYDPTKLLADPNSSSLASAALDPTQCSTSGCPYTVPGVNIAGVTLGLIASALDGNATQWMPTYTGIANPNTVVAAQASKPSSVTATPAFILSVEGFGAFAQLAAVDPATLLERGAFIGVVVGTVAESAQPVAGATVSLASADPNVTIVYPNATFTGTQTSTAAGGLFLAFPTTARTVINSWVITPGSGDTHTWAPVTAGSAAGKVLIVAFAAST